jgi:WNK lysine deficient protein kinase
MLPDIVTWKDPTGRFICKAEPLGMGATKSVFRAFDKQLGCEVAWSKSCLRPSDVGENTSIRREVEMLESMDHPRIVKLITSWVDDRTNEIILITDMYHGALDAYVRKHGKQELCVIRKWASQICAALRHLHCHFENPIAHRDIKCANIFLNNYTGDVAVGDLGFATVTSRSRSNSSILGTAEFMAPEVLKGHCDHRADVYSFGMTLIEMATQRKPYSRIKNINQLYMLVLNGSPPEELLFVENENLRGLIEKCISRANIRPSIEEVMNAPFMTDGDGDFEKVEDLVSPLVSFDFFKSPIERYCLSSD